MLQQEQGNFLFSPSFLFFVILASLTHFYHRLVLAAAVTKPTKVRIVAELGFVRNSIGSDAYLSDEIITSHAGIFLPSLLLSSSFFFSILPIIITYDVAGVRCLIGNTDAEGRMVLSDCLSHLRLHY